MKRPRIPNHVWKRMPKNLRQAARDRLDYEHPFLDRWVVTANNPAIRYDAQGKFEGSHRRPKWWEQ